jgi:PPK2 family polyphosphate:nucleotide phosphotransferase
MFSKDLLQQLQVTPGQRLRLGDRGTGWAQTEALKDLGKSEAKEVAKTTLEENLRALADAQQLLYADNRYSVLVILQAMDAAGKDGTIKHVMSGVNPQGCQVFSFKQPSAEELDHNFLWRHMRRLPERGRIGIFNRSYYEDVLIVKVHPEILDRQAIPPGKRNDAFWQARYDDINSFERHLTRNGTVIIKFFLHLSKKEQKQRFLDRLNEPDKHWKFSADDVKERQYWNEYQQAYEDALNATSTEWAPWYVIPADQKWASRACVADILTNTISELNLRYPPVSDAQKLELEESRKQLLAE